MLILTTGLATYAVLAKPITPSSMMATNDCDFGSSVHRLQLTSRPASRTPHVIVVFAKPPMRGLIFR